MHNDTLLHHANMLNDSTRLNQFSLAMRNVLKPESKVVDIGAGTGILSAIARQYTEEQIYSIEYFDDTMTLLKNMLSRNKINNINPITGSSFEICLKNENPDVLVSETIGLIGPEENIVEIFYDFCRRHPSITACIPAELSIHAQFVYSDAWEKQLNNIQDKYANASMYNFNFEYIFSDIAEKISDNILQTDLSNCTTVGSSMSIAKYILGQTFKSDFSHSFDVREMRNNCNAVHLYFEAKLHSNVILSSRYDNQVHWGHSFVPLNLMKDQLNVSYKHGSGIVAIAWRNQ